MNYTILENPYKEGSVINTRGVMTDAKVAKLNNAKKRPALVGNWESLRPKEVVVKEVSTPKDYNSLLNSIGITVVNYSPSASNTGAKKLRVNKIVNEKARKIYNNSNKSNVIPAPVIEEAKPIETEIKIESAFTPNVVNSREDIRGRHERTGEIPVNDIKEAVRNDIPPVSNPSYVTRAERNIGSDLANKPENKAGDMDLYNNLLHSVNQNDDVSRQLQGARNQLSIEKEENRKLAERYGEAVKELAKLKEDIETTKKQKEQKAKEELSMTLKSIENLQKENLERTSDLTSIQSEIARLKAEKQAIEASSFE